MRVGGQDVAAERQRLPEREGGRVRPHDGVRDHVHRTRLAHRAIDEDVGRLPLGDRDVIRARVGPAIARPPVVEARPTRRRARIGPGRDRVGAGRHLLGHDEPLTTSPERPVDHHLPLRVRPPGSWRSPLRCSNSPAAVRSSAHRRRPLRGPPIRDPRPRPREAEMTSASGPRRAPHTPPPPPPRAAADHHEVRRDGSRPCPVRRLPPLQGCTTAGLSLLRASWPGSGGSRQKGRRSEWSCRIRVGVSRA